MIATTTAGTGEGGPPPQTAALRKAATGLMPGGQAVIRRPVSSVSSWLCFLCPALRSFIFLGECLLSRQFLQCALPSSPATATPSRFAGLNATVVHNAVDAIPLASNSPPPLPVVVEDAVTGALLGSLFLPPGRAAGRPQRRRRGWQPAERPVLRLCRWADAQRRLVDIRPPHVKSRIDGHRDDLCGVKQCCRRLSRRFLTRTKNHTLRGTSCHYNKTTKKDQPSF